MRHNKWLLNMASTLPAILSKTTAAPLGRQGCLHQQQVIAMPSRSHPITKNPPAVLQHHYRHSTDNHTMTTSASYTTLVQELYVSYFGRLADSAGLQNFEAAPAAINAQPRLPAWARDEHLKIGIVCRFLGATLGYCGFLRRLLCQHIASRHFGRAHR
jgi:hypothetical protein